MSQSTPTAVSLATIQAEAPRSVHVHQETTDFARAETFDFEIETTVEAGQLVISAQWSSYVDHPATTPMTVTGHVVVTLRDGQPVVGEPTVDVEKGDRWIDQSPESETAEKAAIEAAREAIEYAVEAA